MSSESLIQLNYASIDLLEDHHFRKQMIAWLSPQELQQFERFSQPPQADQYLLARGMLRHRLSQKCPEVSPEQWQFIADAQGKPRLDDVFSPLNIHFNLSHSDGMVVLAISEAFEIGVDVEAISRPVFSMALAQRYFAESEIKMLQSLTPPQQALCVAQLWTLKESCLKAEGVGLRIPLRQLAFSFYGREGLQRKISVHADDVNALKGVRFSGLYSLGTDYSLALAIKASRDVCSSEIVVDQGWKGLGKAQNLHCQLLRMTSVEN